MAGKGGPTLIADSILREFILAKTMGFNNLMMAIRIENFTPIEAFRERMDTLIDLLKSAPLAKGADAILMPGEKEFRMEQKRKKESIKLG